MSCTVELELEIAEPVELELITENPVCIIPDPLPYDESLIQAHESEYNHDSIALYNPLTGDKYSSTDAGTFGQTSIGDDYYYVCVKTGTAGNATWKKTPLFIST